MARWLGDSNDGGLVVMTAASRTPKGSGASTPTGWHIAAPV